MNLKFTVNRIHCIHPFGISRSSHTYYDIVYVYIERDGIIGRGEAAPSDRYNESTDNILSVLKNGITLNEDMVKSNIFYEQLVPQCNGLKSLEVALSMALLSGSLQISVTRPRSLYCFAFIHVEVVSTSKLFW